MKIKHVFIALLMLTGIIRFIGCKKDEKVNGCMDAKSTNYNSKAQLDDGSCKYEFQGPLNPSFETKDNWQLNYSQAGYAAWVNGTGFMPTQGIWYMDISAEPTNNWYSGNASIYQDSVSFRLSKTITFDYSIIGQGKNGTVNIMFTSNGTDTLWHITDTIAVNKKDEVINLPTLPDKGRLMIQVQTWGGASSYTDFKIDNIRVQ